MSFYENCMADPRDTIIAEYEKLLNEREKQYAKKYGEFVSSCDAFDLLRNRFDVERRAFANFTMVFERALHERDEMRDEINRLKFTVGLLMTKIEALNNHG